MRSQLVAIIVAVGLVVGSFAVLAWAGEWETLIAYASALAIVLLSLLAWTRVNDGQRRWPKPYVSSTTPPADERSPSRRYTRVSGGTEPDERTRLDPSVTKDIPASTERPTTLGGAKAAASEPQSRIYPVWFGTNRQPLIRANVVVGFSSSRDFQTHYGTCEVVIPKSHKIGSIGSPLWKRLVTLSDDRLRLEAVKALLEDAYWDSIRRALQTVAVEAREAVIFLHGYNVSFEGAALRAAQIGYDLGIAGVMAFYSWPSRGTLKGYSADEASIEASEGFIADFLTRVATKSGAARVHIIAHSMGNRGLLRAIDRIATTAAGRANVTFSQIILAAADVDCDTFTRLSVAYRSVAQRTTMYVCARDRAVEASHWLHDYPRAGLAPPVLVVPGIDTINVSNLDLTLLGHGYVAEARDVLQDMHRLMRESSPPERRFGLRRETTPEGGVYWMVGA